MHLVSQLPLGKAQKPRPCSRQRGALMALQVLANNDAPGSDGIPGCQTCIDAASRRNAHLAAFPIRVPAIAIFGPTICIVVVNAASFSGAALPPFSSPERVRLSASFLEYLPSKQTRHRLRNACPWRLHQVPCNASFWLNAPLVMPPSDPSTCSCTSWRRAPLQSGIRVDEGRPLASDLLAILPACNGNVRPSAFIGPPSLGGLTVRPVAG